MFVGRVLSVLVGSVVGVGSVGVSPPMPPWVGRDSATVLVIGSPGHGKSTFLNEFSDEEEELFATSATADSCTKETSSKIIKTHYDDGTAEGRVFSLNLVDSPGFPDPDAASAVAMYDNVVTAASAPLNAIVWLVKGERAKHTVFAEYKMLMREFNNVQPPIFMVVNGQQSYTEKDLKKNKHKNDYKDLMEYGHRCAANSSVAVQRTWVSTTKGELSDISKQVFMAALAEPPKVSNLKTYKQLETELSGLKSQADWVQHEQRKLEEAILKAEASKKNNEEVLAWATAAVVAATATSAFFPLAAPFVGPVSTALLITLQEELGEHNKQLTSLIEANKISRAKLPENPQSLVQALREQLYQLFKALTGEDRHEL